MRLDAPDAHAFKLSQNHSLNRGKKRWLGLAKNKL